MDALSMLLENLKKEARIQEHFPGLLHVLIGRRISTSAGEPISGGLSWRELAAKLKKIRWDPDAVRQLGLTEKELPPRDRERFWHVAITRAQVDSAAALASAEKVAEILSELGYVVSDPPRRAT